MAKKTLAQLYEEKQKQEDRIKKLNERIKDAKRAQGERIALLAVDLGLTELDISDEEWKLALGEMKIRFQQSASK